MSITITLTKTGFDSGTDPVASGTMLTFAGSLETVLSNMVNGLQAFDRILWSAPATLTLGTGSSDGIAPSPSQFSNYLAAAIGTLDELYTLGPANNSFVMLKAAPGHVMIIHSGGGNITTLDGNDITLSGGAAVLAWCQGNQWSVTSTGGVKNNTIAAVDPASSDSSSNGYDEGSIWLNTFNDRAFFNVMAGAGVGVWPKITPDVNGFGLRAAAATIQPSGTAAPTITGTPANVNAADGTFVTLPTGASLGNVGGFVSPTFNLLRLNYDPILEWLIKTDASLTAIRIWIGLTTADQTSSDTAAGSFAGFRYSSVVPDPGWVGVNRDGTNQDVSAKIADIALNTLYKLRMRVASATPTVYLSVNDGAEVAHPTNLPAISTDLGYLCRPITTAAGAKILNFSYMKAGW